MVVLSDEIWELAVREVSKLVVSVAWEGQDDEDAETEAEGGAAKGKEREVGDAKEERREGEGKGKGKRVAFDSATPPLPPAKRAREDDRVCV